MDVDVRRGDGCAIRIGDFEYQFNQQPGGWPGPKIPTDMPTLVNIHRTALREQSDDEACENFVASNDDKIHGRPSRNRATPARSGRATQRISQLGLAKR